MRILFRVAVAFIALSRLPQFREADCVDRFSLYFELDESEAAAVVRVFRGFIFRVLDRGALFHAEHLAHRLEIARTQQLLQLGIGDLLGKRIVDLKFASLAGDLERVNEKAVVLVNGQIVLRQSARVLDGTKILFNVARFITQLYTCLLYTSDAADEL